MNEQQVKKALQEVGVKISGGMIIFTTRIDDPDMEVFSSLSWAIADRFVDCDIDIVLALTNGNIVLVNPVRVAQRLFQKNNRKKILAVYTDKPRAETVGRKKVLVVKDTLMMSDATTGIIEAIHKAGGEAVGVGVICNWGHPAPERLGVRVEALIHEKV